MIPADLADRLCAVGGVVAVALGGSRARGEHRPDSDWDLGLYYRGELDVPGLRRWRVWWASRARGGCRWAWASRSAAGAGSPSIGWIS
ncbi:nucleotidyltransferase domain-containing protein [Micromonospora sp. NPDC048170]|uniref:nucleotidyltransferase domain-containing protein n=1 Tax=Micromonospora sp. NPDC048170 TaxID=3154819 RepID=UPI0033D827BC